MQPLSPIPIPRSRIPPLKIAVLASGRGSNLQALIDARRDGQLPIEVVLVAGDKAQALALRRAETAGIPTLALDPRGYASRAAYDADLFARIAASGAELVVLAGFMRILTARFLDAFPARVINIHPSLLPAFPGVDAQKQALDKRVRITGCTVHLVDAGTDTGPILAQARIAVLPGDTPETLADRLLAHEHRLLVATIAAIAARRITLGIEGVLHDGVALEAPLQLRDGQLCAATA